MYAPNAKAQYQLFLNEIIVALQKVTSAESIVLLGDFNTHVGNDDKTWKGVVGRQGDFDINKNGRYLLQFFATNELCLMQTFFRLIQRYTWYRDLLEQRSIIDFCIISVNLFSSVIDVRVKKETELPTDHHLVVYILKSLNHPRRKERFRAQSAYRITWRLQPEKKLRHTFPSKVVSLFRELLNFTVKVLRLSGIYLNQKPLHLHLLIVVANVWKVKRVVRRELLGGTKKLKKLYGQRKLRLELLTVGIPNKSSEQLRLRYFAASKTSVIILKQSRKFEKKLETNYRFANKVFWKSIRYSRGNQTPVATFIEGANSVLLKYQKGILNCWRECCCELLNPVTVPHLEIFEE